MATPAFQPGATVWSPRMPTPTGALRGLPASGNASTLYAAPFPITTLGKTDVNEQPDARQEKKDPSTLGKIWKNIILFAPVLGFIGSSTLIIKSLPRGFKTGLVNGLLKAGGRAPVAAEKIDGQLKAMGQRVLGFAVLLKSLGGISAGVVCGQPSMIWGNLIQILPAGILAFKRSNAMQNFATSMEMLLGGFYTIGFANELKNKDDKTPPEQIRRYDMTRLKSLFDWGNGLTLEKRLTGLFSEMAGMAKFTAQDHVQLVKDLWSKGIHGFSGNASERSVQPLKDRLSEWAKEPSATKSQLAALFFYMGTLPILLLTRHNPKIGEKFPVVALKFIGMAIANLAPFAIALNRDDLRGKAPLIGAPMAALGMANSRNPFFVGMGHLGEAFNDLFFSDVAVNGVTTKSESRTQTTAIDKTA
jgi:hypothetical protein